MDNIAPGVPQDAPIPQITQASALPEANTNFTLNPVRILNGQDDWSMWLTHVKLELELHNLEDVIDNTIPKPAPDDPDYKWWRKCSKTVRVWLSRHISDRLLHSSNNDPEEALFADAFINKLHRLVNGAGHAAYHLAWKELFFIKRSSYCTIEQFVQELQKKIERCTGLGIEISPYMAMGILLGSVENELGVYVKVKYANLPISKVKELTWIEFHQTCAEVIGEAGRTNIGSNLSATLASSKNSNTNNKRQRNNLVGGRHAAGS